MPGCFPTAEPRPSAPATVICDDLSGACEVAGLLHEAGSTVVIELSPRRVAPVRAVTDDDRNRVRVVDLACRDEVTDVVHARARAIIESSIVRYVKVDSLVRGPIATIVDACRDGRRRVLVCPALPAAGRTVVAGVPLLHGRPVGSSRQWRVEPGAPPADLSELLAPLESVRLDAASLASVPNHTVVWADAADDDDLDRIADLVARHDLLPIGSAGLLGAIVRRNPIVGRPHRAPEAPAAADPCGVLVVVGTGSAEARAQIFELGRDGAVDVELDPEADTVAVPYHARALLADGGTVVVHWRHRDVLDPSRSTALNDALADAAAGAVADHPHISLVLTGGRTARSVLDRLGVTTLTPTTIVHHGALVATTNDGRRVGIRPGSFGDRHSLVDIRNAAA